MLAKSLKSNVLLASLNHYLFNICADHTCCYCNLLVSYKVLDTISALLYLLKLSYMFSSQMLYTS